MQVMFFQMHYRRYWPEEWSDDGPVVELTMAYLQFRKSYNCFLALRQKKSILDTCLIHAFQSYELTPQR